MKWAPACWSSPAEVLSAFLPQYYLAGARAIPGEIILNRAPEDRDTLEEALGIEAGHSHNRLDEFQPLF